MNLFFYKIIFILILAFSFKINASEIAPHFIIDKNLSALDINGRGVTIPKGSYLRLANYHQNFDKWYHEVYLVDSNDKPLNLHPFRISQYYLTPQMSYTTRNSLSFMDHKGEEVIVPKGKKYIITGTKKENWKSYNIHFVDDEGVGVDHKGIHVDSEFVEKEKKKKDQKLKSEYRISHSSLDFDRMTALYDRINRIKAEVKDIVRPVQIVKCVQESTEVKPEPVKEESKEIEIKIDFTKNSYEQIVSQRLKLRSKYGDSCETERRNLEEKFLREINHPYAKLNTLERANRIIEESRDVFSEMHKASSNEDKRKSKSRYRNFVNGHYIDPLITPEVVACISFQETEGTLNPLAINLTSCFEKMPSSAHGFGQMTLTTMKGLKENPDGEGLPLNTKYSKKYQGKTSKQIHRGMTSDQFMQFEVALRLMNSNIKFMRWKKPNLSDDEILRKALVQYDTDQKSKWMNKVLDKCIPCLKRGEKGAQCYKNYFDL